MDKLRGTGNTFSTSGKEWLPFRHDPALGRKLARANRIKGKGLALPESKASLRAIAEQAAIERKPRKV